MEKSFHSIIFGLLTSGFIVFPQFADAVEIEFYPRIDTGLKLYSIEYSPESRGTLSKPGKTSGSNFTSGKRKYSDIVSTIGGGTTFFMNRMFIDLSGQYTFEGCDTSKRLESTYTEREDNLTSIIYANASQNLKFNHLDYAVSVGYAVTRKFSVFFGYKWAYTNMDSTFSGDVLEFMNNYGAIDMPARFHKTIDTTLKYKGPFIGVTNGWEIDALRYLKGVLSIKLGLTYLDSKEISLDKGTITYSRDNTTDSWLDRDEQNGSTWGFTLGLGWQGLTPINKLSYLFHISGYRYNFDFDSNEYYVNNVTESVLDCKIGLSYAF